MEIKGSITLSHTVCALFAYNTERPRAVKTFLDLRHGGACVRVLLLQLAFWSCVCVWVEEAMLLWSEDAEILEYFAFCAQLRRATHITRGGYRYALCVCVRRRLYF